MAEPQGMDDQYVFTCCAAQHLDKPCLLFHVVEWEDGTRMAWIADMPRYVPVDEVMTYSRSKTEAAHG